MKVGLIAPTPNDSTSFYRAYGIFPYLARECDFELITGDKWGWENVIQCDLLIMQRPWIDAHKHVAEMAKTMNIPVWLDYDDNLYSVQRSNPAFNIFMNPGSHQNLRRLAEIADVVTVTTKALASLYKNSVIVPNAFNDYLWEFTKSPRNQTITWRGGISHYGDMEPFLPVIGEVARNNPGWDWRFMGDPHWGIEGVIPADSRFLHPFIDVFHFIHQFVNFRPAIHIVPLVENSFNACKSNLAYIEATIAGAVTLAPDWVEWRCPGIVLYKDPKHFGEQLTMLIGMKQEDRDSMVELARAYVKENLSLSKINQTRIGLINKLCERVVK